MNNEAELFQSLAHHWDSENGKWSCYVFGDEFRVTHKRNDGFVGYGKLPFDGSLEIWRLEEIPMEYVKEKDIVKCIRCGKRDGGQFRTDFNDAYICERCYDVIINDDGSQKEYYEITPCGFKGSKIK